MIKVKNINDYFVENFTKEGLERYSTVEEQVMFLNEISKHIDYILSTVNKDSIITQVAKNILIDR